MAFSVTAQNRFNLIVEEFKNSNSSNVIVSAHRGDWRHTPENSIKGIENCIAMGVDIVEVDVHKTKDNILVLMHDETINRMTTGKWKIFNRSSARNQKQILLQQNQSGRTLLYKSYFGKRETIRSKFLRA